ncbi:MAG TPA: glycosyltransferase family 1 protein, partial [Actinomycetota bacterium]|nr:glycosyltransferase family 1 protein [Actinomycetota bacterium]
GRFPNRVYRKLRGLNALPPVEWLLGPLDAMLGPAYVTWRCSRAAELPVVHDLSFIRFPESVSWQNLYFLRWNVPRMIKRAATVVTVSESSRREIAARFDVPASDVAVVPNGCDHERFGDPDAPRAFDLPPGYLLFVGTREPRKNLPMVLRAHEHLSATRADVPPLVVVGGAGWRGKELESALERHRLARDVRILGYVPDELLAGLYQDAAALVFPSLYEGFGLPIVEAMAAGCPVVTSDRGAMAEVGGSAVVAVDPEDHVSIASGIARILDDPSLRERLVDEGIERARSMSWTRSGEALRDAVERAVAKKTAAHSR